MMSTSQRRSETRRISASSGAIVGWTFVLASLGGAGCAIEGDEACGAHQIYKTGSGILDYAVCVCDESDGYVFDERRGYGCVRCDEGESIVNGKCAAPQPDAGAQEDAASRPEPTGEGEFCKTNADCASFDAKFCAPTMGACLIHDCASKTNACSSVSVCCDYSKLLAGLSLCVPPEYIEGGECPMQGMKVDP
jgi:hypothetical protein